MKKSAKNIIIILSFILVWSCGKSEILPSELIHWVDDKENGLVQRQEFEHYFFEAKYKPLDYVISMEGRTDHLSETKYATLKRDLEGLQYVDMTIGPLSGSGDALSSGIESNDEYFERLDYFVTYANQDIFMVQGQDTLYPKLYHFERNYGLAPKNTLLLGFAQGEENKDRYVYIDDKILGVGRVKFLFEDKHIKNTPILKRD